MAKAEMTTKSPATLTLKAFADQIRALDAIEGLQGVCFAFDQSAQYAGQIHLTHQLAMAAKALSTMLASRLPQ